MSVATFTTDCADIAFACEATLKQLPTDFNLWYVLGNIYHEYYYEHQKAIHAYTKATQIEKDRAELWQKLAIVLYCEAKYKKSATAYKKALRLAPEVFESWVGLGDANKHIEQYEKARLAYQKALALDSLHDETWNKLGNLLNDKLKEHEASLACFDKVMELDKDAYWAIRNKALAYSNMGKYEKALECCQKALAIKPDYVNARDSMGIIHLNQRNLDEAKKCFQANITQYPRYSNSIYNMGCVYAVEGNKKKALLYLQKAIAINKKDYQTYAPQDVDYESLWQDADFVAIVNA